MGYFQVRYDSRGFIRLATSLVVMGDGSCSRGRGFESWCCVLDGHFSTLICYKNYIVCLKRPNANKKRPGWPIFLKKQLTLHQSFGGIQIGICYR